MLWAQLIKMERNSREKYELYTAKPKMREKNFSKGIYSPLEALDVKMFYTSPFFLALVFTVLVVGRSSVA